MFGRYFRAPIEIGIAVLSAAILNFVVPFFLPFLGPEDSFLYQSFAAVANNALFIMLVAVAAGVLAAAVTESSGVR